MAKDKDEKKMMTGTCRFCHNQVMVAADGELTTPQLEEAATMGCSCDKAAEYQKEKMRKEKAMKNVQILFGADAAPDKRASEDIVKILQAAVEEIYTGGLAKVTLNLRGGVKASVSQIQQGRNQCGAHRDTQAEADGVKEGKGYGSRMERT